MRYSNRQPGSRCDAPAASDVPEARLRFTAHWFGAALLATACAVSAQNSDPNVARSLAATCSNCHGPGGVSQSEIASLAGFDKETLVRNMQEFKAGRKPSTIMQQLAKGYTDEQIELIAGWYATRKSGTK
jgi:cytochrome subunit of sulfide dehydrogenase